ncbi:MAG: fimbrillin family protein, partial [Duncaniella sp.]|nr:fimbrillin family protein [Duncaniella sp.]
YWKDKHTRIDVYGYYPFASPDKVNSYPFTVKTDQSLTYDDGSMGNYEASDFLWGKVEGVEPTANVIRLPLAHRMAGARVTLIEGSGFADGEWTDLQKQVLVSNTIHSALIDLSTGSVTPDGEVSSTSIIPARHGDEWRAVVVPQTVKGGTTLFNLSIDGMPYRFSKSEDFTYVGGKMNNFGIRIDKKTPSGTYQLTLISESITAWENDLVSHDATAREYVVINSTPGGLEQAIADAGKNAAELKNLKVTGEISAADFYFMRDSMTKLQALNLKEVKIVTIEGFLGDEIPTAAFHRKESLLYLTLPDKIKKIGEDAFYACLNLTGSLNIPSGVEEIGRGAFWYCSSLKGELSLPKGLRVISASAFSYCGFTSQLYIPESVNTIED